MYYYYAYIEQNIVLEVYRFRKEQTGEEYIIITEEQYNATVNGVEGSIMGKYWDGQNFVDNKHYYYAVINESNFVIEVIKSKEVINTPSTHIEIDSIEAVKIGQIYEPETGIFRDAQFHEIAHTDTDWISVSGTDVALTTKLNEMQSAINGIEIPEVTGESIIEKLKDVDGTGSGLDADLLDGKDCIYFATKEEVQSLNSVVDGKAATNHTHSDYATGTELQNLATTVNGKAATNHTHSDYVTGTQLQSLTTVVNGKAAVSHTHSEYATAVHTHASNAVIARIQYNAGKVALSNQATKQIISGVEVYSEMGGWTDSDGYLIVPKTGTYMMELGGSIMYVSGSLAESNLICVSFGLENSFQQNLPLGDSVIAADIFNAASFKVEGRSIPATSTSILNRIISLDQGTKFKFRIDISTYYNDKLLTCGINVKPYIVIREI